MTGFDVTSRVGLATPLARAITEAVAYADVFEFPLTAGEAHRSLGVACAPADVARTLGEARPAGVRTCGDYLLLEGREHLVEVRRRRRHVASGLWPSAWRYGRLMATLPFVRLVAVSGALAVDNVDPEADIDFFIVAAPGRVWTCRALVILVVRLAGQRGIVLCPNYVVSERAMVMSDRSLFTAHEVTQLVPIAGKPTYGRFRDVNRWTDRLLPNAAGPPRAGLPRLESGSVTSRIAERMSRNGLGAGLERWERDRKIRRLSTLDPGAGESAFGEEYCKGHFDAHRGRVMRAYADRLASLGLSVRASGPGVDRSTDRFARTEP